MLHINVHYCGAAGAGFQVVIRTGSTSLEGEAGFLLPKTLAEWLFASFVPALVRPVRIAVPARDSLCIVFSSKDYGLEFAGLSKGPLPLVASVLTCRGGLNLAMRGFDGDDDTEDQLP